MNGTVPVDPLNSMEWLISVNTVRSKNLYIIVIGLVLISVTLLPIIKINLSVQGQGIIRPVTEKAEIKALKSEIVERVFIVEGQYVEKGDTLV